MICDECTAPARYGVRSNIANGTAWEWTCARHLAKIVATYFPKHGARAAGVLVLPIEAIA